MEVKANMSVTPSNVLTSQIADLEFSLSLIAQKLIDRIPKSNPQNFAYLQTYLTNFWNNDKTLRRTITNLAIISAESPLISFQLFVNSMPSLNISETKVPPVSSGTTQTSFLNRLKNIDYSDLHVRYTLANFIEGSIAMFLYITLENCDERVKISAEHLTELLMLRFEPKSYYTDDYQKLRMLVAPHWAGSMGYLSNYLTGEHAQQAIDFCKLYKTSDKKKCEEALYFILYSKFLFIGVQMPQNLNEIFKNILKISNTDPRHGPSIEYLTNLLIRLCIINPEYSNSKLFKTMYEGIHSLIKGGYTGQAQLSRALLTAFSNYPKIQFNLIEYLKRHIISKINLTKQTLYCLQQLIILLRGKCYSPIYKNGEQFKGPFIIKGKENLLQILDLVISNPYAFKGCQNELSEFIAQLAAVDIDIFINVIFPKIFQIDSDDPSKSIFITENVQAVFHAAKVLIHTHFNFPISDSQRDLLVCNVRESACQLAKIENFRPSTPICAFQLESFVHSLITHGDDIVTTLLYMDEESEPQMPDVKKKGFVNIQKWEKLIQSNNHQLFAQNECDITLFNEDIEGNVVLTDAICVIPLTIPDNLTASELIGLVYSESPYVGAATIRALQSIVHQNPTLISSLYEAMISTISTKLLCEMHTLYISLLTVDCILESVIYTRSHIPNDVLEFINLVSVVGLSAPCHLVRSIVFQINQKVKPISNETKSISYYIDDDLIAHTARNNSLSMIKYKHYSDYDVQFFKFIDIANNNFENLYQFYLASLASHIRQAPESFNLEQILEKITTMLQSRKSEIEARFIANLIIFLVNAATDQDFSGYFNLFKQKSGDNRTSYFALFSAISAESCKKLFFSNNKIGNMFIPGALYSVRLRVDYNELGIDDNSIYDIFKFLDQYIGYFNNFSQPKLKFIPPKIENEDRQHMILLLQFSEMLFNKIQTKFISKAKGNFPRSHMLSSDEQIKIDQTKWIIMSANFSGGKDEITPHAKKTLASILGVFPIPDDYYEAFIQHMALFENDSPIILAHLLRQSYVLQIEPYIRRAMNNPTYFKAISYQFQEAETLDEAIFSAEQLYTSEISDFDQYTYRWIGALFALCFHYILSTDSIIRGYAFRMFEALIIGCCSIRNQPAAVVLMKLDIFRPLLKTQLPSICLPPAIALSEAMAKNFSFFSEQFVFYIFKLINITPDLQQIIQPWIKDISLSEETPQVFVGCDQIFTSFTAYTYIKQLLTMSLNPHTLTIIGNSVKDQKPNSLNVLHFIIVTIVSTISSSNELPYINILAYLYSICPHDVVNKLISILTYENWHYHQVQMNKEDALFDMEEFLNKLSSSQSISSTDQKFEIEEESPDYSFLVKFVLRTYFLCASESIEPLKEVLPQIVLFAYLYQDEYADDLDGILHKVLPEYYLGDQGIQNYLISLESDVREKLGVQVLAWGLCCGELTIATKALKFYQLMKPKVCEKAAQAIMESMFVAYRCLYEYTHNMANKKDQWLFHVMEVNKEPEWENTRLYISLCISVLEDAQPTANIFELAVSILNCNTPEYGILFNAALKLLTCIICKSKEDYQPAVPLLQVIASTTFNENTPTYFFNFMKALQDNNKTSYFTKKEQVFELIMNVVNMLETDEPLKEIDDLSCFSDSEIDSILLILARIISTSNGKPISIIDELCIKILNIKKYDFEGMTLGILARAVMNDKYFGNINAINRLLQIINMKCGVIAPIPLATKFRNIPVIPSIVFPFDFDPNESTLPESVNQFEKIETFPPLYISDYGYLFCPITKKVSPIVQRVAGQPFPQWSDLFFKCQSLSIDPESMSEYSNPQIHKANNHFFNELRRQLLECIEEERAAILDIDQTPQAGAGSPEDEQSLLLSSRKTSTVQIVDDELFVPDNSVLDLLVSCLITDSSIPFVIPN